MTDEQATNIIRAYEGMQNQTIKPEVDKNRQVVYKVVIDYSVESKEKGTTTTLEVPERAELCGKMYLEEKQHEAAMYLADIERAKRRMQHLLLSAVAQQAAAIFTEFPRLTALVLEGGSYYFLTSEDDSKIPLHAMTTNLVVLTLWRLLEDWRVKAGFPFCDVTIKPCELEE